MTKKSFFLVGAVTILTACGSNRSSEGAGGEQLTAVGSSTVYPFTTAVAEQFQRARPGTSVIVESTGTGAGLKLFCAGVGQNFPDLTSASRRIKPSEADDCNKHGVKEIIELPIGIDGLTVIESVNAQPMKLSLRDLYLALAAKPFGKAQTAQTWKDVNPALPATKIRVMGPPPTSGTRDSLNEMFIQKGCETDPAMKALKDTDADKHKDICTNLREDGAFIEGGENDNLLVQKVASDPTTLGVLGYSFLEENSDKVRAVGLNGVMPNAATISDLSYPGARTIYIYAKGEHLRAKPAIKDFLADYAKAAVKGGLLQRRGLVPFAPAEAAAAQKQAGQLSVLNPAELK
ncbi:substrate-binding domain-containing protein [Sphingomonas sp.]|uniref:substrate-binding domain-containing protein n=1 Tax=Sphingomonas sp. TaxID=28214 RepID=UPI0017AC60FB|nr:substrate-binding domain-containing protein [Sphingomonas sp.]MBA3511216.1 substrate-binding domain-containing protein [Sphingomonas sp.]